MNRLISSRVVIIILVSINITNGLFLSTKMKYPFKRISNTVVIQQMKLKCDEHYNSVKVCAEQSYHGNRLNNSNVGFILDTKTKFCKICNFFEVSEKQNFTNNDTGVNQVLYLLGQNKIPDLYFPLEPENFTWPNVTGQGVDATLQGNTTQVGGRIKGGLFFSGRERILLQGSNRTCFGYLSACSKGLTLTMWIKISGDSSTQYLLRGHNSLTIILHNKRYFFGWLYDFDGTRTASFFVEVENYKGIWYHIGASYSRHVGFSLYLNGVLRNFTPISNLKNSTQESYDYSFSIGDLDQGFTGILDEVKFFYTELDHTGEFCTNDLPLSPGADLGDGALMGQYFSCPITLTKSSNLVKILEN